MIIPRALSPRRYTLLLPALLIFMSLKGLAQNPTDVPIATRALLEAALTHENGLHFVPTLEIVLQAAPGQADNILALARQIGVDHLDEIALIAAARAGNPRAVAARSAAAVPKVIQAEIDPSRGREAGFLSLGPWAGGVELGFSSSTGDTTEKALAFGLELNRTFSKLWEHQLDLDVDVARRAGLTSKELYRSDYQVYYRKWDRAFIFTELNFEYDRFSGFDYRIAESAGLGYRMIDSKRQKWNLQGGPGLRHSKLEAGPLQTEPLAVLNSSYRLFLSESVSTGNETKLFFGERRTTVNSEFDLRVRLINALSARFSFNLRFDSEVPAGTRRTDTLTKITLVYDF